MPKRDRTERCELTVLCLIRDGSRILLQNRVKNDWCGYTLPGGHIEPGESVVEAVIREMREETGLTVIRPHLCGIKQFPIEAGRYLVFLFTADEFTGELRSSVEGAVEWIERERLPELPTVKDFAQLLSVMEDESRTEFQYETSGGKWNAVLR